METQAGQESGDLNEIETREWLDSLDYVIQRGQREELEEESCRRAEI